VDQIGEDQMRQVSLGTMLAGASALAICAAQPVFAQGAAASDGATGSTGGAVDEVVVTAQKRVEKISDVPLSIATATGDELARRGITDPTQLEQLAPGFSFQKSSYGVPVFSLRGVGFYDTTQGVTPAVAVYVDQIALPYSAMTRGASLDVERVEVLKGPQGTLFGQNSTGGAVNYIAAKPTEALAYGANLEYGRFNAVNAEGYVSGPIADNLTARLSLRVERQDDWQYSYTRNAHLGDRKYVAGRLLVDWRPTSAALLELGLTAWRDTSDTQQPQVLQLAFQTVDPRAANPPAILALTNYPLAPDNARAADWDIGRDFSQDNRFYQATLHADVQISDGVKLTSLSSFIHYHTLSLTDADGTNYTSLAIQPDATMEDFSQEVRLSGDTPGGRVKWMIGANYNHAKVYEDQLTYTGGTSHILLGIPFLATVLVNHQKIDTEAVFGSVSLGLTNQVTFEGSARYTWEKRDFVGCIRDAGDGSLAAVFGLLATIISGSPKIILPGQCVTLDQTFTPTLVHDTLKEDNLSWRGSLNWEPSEELLLYASLSKGYKAGNFSTIPGLTPEQFDPLRQESILAYEAGFKATLLERTLQLNAAAFYYDYTDKQLLGSIQNPVFGTLPGSVAIPKSRVQGWEADVTWRPIEALRITGGVSYVDSRIERDPPLPVDPYGVVRSFVGEAFPYTPKWQATVDAEYRFPVRDSLTGYVGGTFTYRSSSFSNFGENPFFVLQSRSLLDLRAGVEAESGRWRVQVFGRNVTNQVYSIQTSRLTDTVLRFTGMPVTYGIQFSFRH
jgi:iron complex outermembrane receptor protein